MSTEQPLIFLVCLGIGVVSCVWYSALWVIRRIFNNKIIGAVCDVVFVLVSATAYFFCLLKTASGEFRIYTLIAFLVGFIGFYFALRPLSKKISPLIDKGMEKLKNRKNGTNRSSHSRRYLRKRHRMA